MLCPELHTHKIESREPSASIYQQPSDGIHLCHKALGKRKTRNCVSQAAFYRWSSCWCRALSNDGYAFEGANGWARCLQALSSEMTFMLINSPIQIPAKTLFILLRTPKLTITSLEPQTRFKSVFSLFGYIKDPQRTRRVIRNLLSFISTSQNRQS